MTRTARAARAARRRAARRRAARRRAARRRAARRRAARRRATTPPPTPRQRMAWGSSRHPARRPSSHTPAGARATPTPGGRLAARLPSRPPAAAAQAAAAHSSRACSTSARPSAAARPALSARLDADVDAHLDLLCLDEPNERRGAQSHAARRAAGMSPPLWHHDSPHTRRCAPWLCAALTRVQPCTRVAALVHAGARGCTVMGGAPCIRCGVLQTAYPMRDLP
eukprot:6758764-Prymnesium_polylepis.2